MQKEKKIVLVTGASSGLGFAVANHLCEMGCTVYAGARRFEKGSTENQSKDAEGRLYRTYLDVTDQASTEALLKQIVEREGRLDVLVNCAAFLVLGSVEDTSIDEYRGVLETNFLGTTRMCKNVVPIMRKQNHGQIVNFSSINGVLGIPFQSAYVSSKFAIEGMTECLSLETKNFGIKVSMIEPSDHRSGSRDYRPHAKRADSTDSAYYDRFKTVTGKIEHDENNGSYPQDLAKLIHKIIMTKRPKLRYTVGKFDQRLSTVVKKILPGRMFEKIIESYYK